MYCESTIARSTKPSVRSSSAASLTPGLRLLPSLLPLPSPPAVVLEGSSIASILTHSFLFTTLLVFHSLLHTLARDYILGLDSIFERGSHYSTCHFYNFST